MIRQTKKVIIIGAGFSGLSAARRLAESGLSLDITLIDKKENSEFLPLLPDCIGRQVEIKALTYKIADFCKRQKIKFAREEARSLDLEKNCLTGETAVYDYDFLLIACGSQTNFFSKKDALENAAGLNAITDVENLTEILRRNETENFIISGGGYTGIEAATHLRRYFNRKKLDKKIIIVEKAPRILGPLPDWMKTYTEENLKKLNIEIFTNSVIEEIKKGNKVKISQERFFDKATVVWVTGVRTADFIQALQVEKNPQGRLVVDEYLRIKPNCFCAGDAAFFGNKENFLRMAVQFSISEGFRAADNIIRIIKGVPLKKFRPLDLGYIVPMANNRSCGIVFGIRVKGLPATWLHFIMCLFRLYSFRNRFSLFKDLLQGGVR